MVIIQLLGILGWRLETAANQVIVVQGLPQAANYRGSPLSVVIVVNNNKHVQLNRITRFTPANIELLIDCVTVQPF